jgi:hypothetical protein
MVALQWQNPQLSLYSSEAALDWMLGLARAVQHLHVASPQVGAGMGATRQGLSALWGRAGAVVQHAPPPSWPPPSATQS